MESNVDTSPDYQLHARISRIIEGVLMLGAALSGFWLLGVIVYSFLK